MALADPAPEPLPFASGYNMVTSSSMWMAHRIQVNKLDPAKKVATYTSGGAEGACNKLVWTIDIVNHASIAQWINWVFSDTRWDLASPQAGHLRRRLHQLLSSRATTTWR